MVWACDEKRGKLCRKEMEVHVREDEERKT